MLQVLRKSLDKTKYLLVSVLILAFLFLLTVVYKSDEKIIKKSESIISSYNSPDLITLKKFILNQIKSPFISLNYETKKGDTIQKILKRYKVRDNEIQTVINQYKKYSNPNQLLVGDKIDIIIEEDPAKNKNSIIKFSIPITKSTTILVTKNEEHKIKGVGNGPIDAFINALKRDLDLSVKVLDYHQHAISTGSDAKAVAYIEIQIEGKSSWGVGMHANTVIAGLLSVISGLNKIASS